MNKKLSACGKHFWRFTRVTVTKQYSLWRHLANIKILLVRLTRGSLSSREEEEVFKIIHGYTACDVLLHFFLNSAVQLVQTLIVSTLFD